MAFFQACWDVIKSYKTMEAISKMMDKAVTEGRLFGFSVGTSTGDHLQITHLLFAYDTFFFG